MRCQGDVSVFCFLIDERDSIARAFESFPCAAIQVRGASGATRLPSRRWDGSA